MLVGREPERAQIREALEGARAGRGAGLLLVGPPGIGKSALLTDAAERGHGFAPMSVSGWEAERNLPYAGLQRLLGPLLPRLSELPPVQLNALKAAFGLAEAVPGSPFLVAMAALAALSYRAEERPLLCLIDDAHWLDEESLGSLGFVLRRLSAEPIVALIAARESIPAVLGPDVTVLTLDRLPPAEAAQLLAHSTDAGVRDDVARRIASSVAGNPLALIETARALSPAELAGQAPLPDPLPAGPELEATYRAVVDALAPATQTFLLLLAAAGEGDAELIDRAAAALRISSGHLEHTGGLLSHPGHSFRHPIIRSIVYHSAPAERRREVHRALADVSTGREQADRHAWHRALSTRDMDEGVASLLEDSAERSRRRSGYSAASSALVRAGDITPGPCDRARRYLRAARYAWAAGDTSRALGLLGRLDVDDLDLDIRADVALLRGAIGWRVGSTTSAAQALLAEAEDAIRAGPRTATALLVEAARAAWAGGDVPLANRAAALLSPLVGAGQSASAATFELGRAALMSGEPGRGVPLLRGILEAARTSRDPDLLVDGGVAATYLADEGGARSLFERAVEVARQAGDIVRLSYALEFAATAWLWCGQYLRAEEAATEGLQLARDSAQVNSAARHLNTLAFVASAQGREADCRTHAAEALRAAITSNLRMVAALAEWALGSLDLWAGHTTKRCATWPRCVSPAPRAIR